MIYNGKIMIVLIVVIIIIAYRHIIRISIDDEER